jgi:hypothetical protein
VSFFPFIRDPVDKASVGDAWLLHPFLFPVLVILVGGGAFDKSKAKAFTSTQETRGVLAQSTTPFQHP